ncbi:MAG: sulfatase [Candidatus Omnitrophica bacterium]|nr:sulfatase [Candidatus Omnitrophota bacterium]
MKPLNIVLITVDCLRADVLTRLQKHGLADGAHIAKLAEKGTRFTNAVTVAQSTAPSLVSILTSSYPKTHKVLMNGLSLDKATGPTLPEVLRSHGYKTSGVISAEHLSSPFGINRGFTSYANNSPFDMVYYFLTKFSIAGKQLSYILNVIRERFNIFKTAWTDADKITKRAKRLLKKHHHSPFFLWVHYFDTHQYASEQEYDQKIKYVDMHVGYLLDYLKKLDKLQETLVVFTADHGEAFNEHGHPKHGWCLYDEVLKVPLILYSQSRLSAGEVANQVRSIDIAPTILDMAGLPIPLKWEGKSLLGHINGKTKDDLVVKVISTSGRVNIQCIRDGRWKLLRYPQEEQLFNILEDKDERKNVIAENAQVANRLRKDLMDTFDFEASEELVDESVKRRLRSLGYFDESL